MEIYYNNNELYINIDDRINPDLIKKLERKISHIINNYYIAKVNFTILNDYNYNKILIDNFISDLNSKYNSIFIVK